MLRALLPVALVFFAASPPAMSAAVQSYTLTLKSGNLDQDLQLWVQGSTQVRPGLRSAGTPLEHPFIVKTPSFWGDLGGGAHWVSPLAAGTGHAGGYEYFTEFTPPDDLLTATLDLVWRGDDVVMPAVNATRFPADGSPVPSGAPGVLHIDLMPLLKHGANRLSFFVENYHPGVDINPTGIDFVANVTYTRASSPTEIATTTVESGAAISQDPQVWVQGSDAARPGLPSSGLPLQHPSVIRKTPAVWAEVGGGTHWLSPSADGTGSAGGYEYYSEFTLPDDFLTATLDVMWRGDSSAALAINGMMIPGPGGGGPKGAPALLHLNLKPLLQRGVNRMSFFVANDHPGMSRTGVDFLANITYTR